MRNQSHTPKQQYHRLNKSQHKPRNSRRRPRTVGFSQYQAFLGRSSQSSRRERRAATSAARGLQQRRRAQEAELILAQMEATRRALEREAADRRAAEERSHEQRMVQLNQLNHRSSMWDEMDNRILNMSEQKEEQQRYDEMLQQDYIGLTQEHGLVDEDGAGFDDFVQPMEVDEGEENLWNDEAGYENRDGYDGYDDDGNWDAENADEDY